MDVTIYHNPECGTSRNTLDLIRHGGIEPTVIEYLSNPPSRTKLVTMIADAGLTVRQAIREKGTPYTELGLDNPSLTDDQLLDAMLKDPILINRPFVVTPDGHPAVPPLGSRPRHPALRHLPRPVHQGRRRAGSGCGGQAHCLICQRPTAAISACPISKRCVPASRPIRPVS